MAEVLSHGRSACWPKKTGHALSLSSSDSITRLGMPCSEFHMFHLRTDESYKKVWITRLIYCGCHCCQECLFLLAFMGGLEVELQYTSPFRTLVLWAPMGPV